MKKDFKNVSLLDTKISVDFFKDLKSRLNLLNINYAYNDINKVLSFNNIYDFNDLGLIYEYLKYSFNNTIKIVKVIDNKSIYTINFKIV